MKVLHTNFLRGWGGQSNRILNESVGLAELGWDVLLSVPPASSLAKRAQAAGLAVDESVRYMGGARLGVLDDVLRMRRLLARFRPDIVHLHGGRDSWVYAEAMLLFPPIPRPLVIRTKHNVFPIADHPPNRWQYGRLFDAIVCLSSAIVDQCAEKPYIAAEKLFRIPSAVEAERFAGDPETRRRIREEFGFDDSHIVVGMTGRLRPEKGHDVLLKAVPQVVERCPEVRFLLLGAGSLQGELAGLVETTGVAENVVLAGFRKDVSDCLQAMDLYVQPSRSEGLGTSVLEACAAGLAVAASRTGGIPDIISHGETGLLAEPESPDALAAAILRLVENPAERASMGARARERVAVDFSIAALVERTDAVYRQLLEKRRNG